MNKITQIINILVLTISKPIKATNFTSDKIRHNSILFLIVAYFLSIVLNVLQFVPFNQTSASETSIDNVKIIAVVVDKDLYSNSGVKSNIQWYAQTYIQSKISDSKAIIFPINKNNFKAKDIVKILQNLYLEGQDNTASNLEGVILIGDIPLPVVNNNGFIFPSIYPYVDFEDKKFIYDEKTSYFTVQGPESGKPEIWHGLINLGESDADNNPQDYIKYFTRLKNYKSDSSNYVSKKFWYDDFVNLQNSYSDNKMIYYLNRFLFLEDLSYHRYTKLLFNIMNIDYLGQLKTNIDSFQKDLSQLKSESITNTQGASKEYDAYTNGIPGFFDKISKFQKDFIGDNWSENLDKNSFQLMPTLSIKQSIETLALDYQSLFGEDLLTRMRDNILSTGRWKEQDLDYHMKYAQLKDNLSTYILTQYNKILEQTINYKIQEGKYYMKLPVFSSYEYHALDECSPMTPQERYENFYFGKNAKDLKSAQELSIYRGNFLNIDNLQQLSGFDYNTLKLDNSGVDLTKKSVGASYGIMTRQVEANRGYNSLLSQSDASTFTNSRCTKSETVQQRSQRYYGGGSPLNINVDESGVFQSLKDYNYKNARNPSFNKSIGGWLYDPAGSKMLQSEQSKAYSYEGYVDYSSVILTNKVAGKKFGGGENACPGLKFEDQIYCKTNKQFGKYENFDFFKAIKSNVDYAKFTFGGEQSNSYIEKISICQKSGQEGDLMPVAPAIRYCIKGKCEIVYLQGKSVLFGQSICPDTVYTSKYFYDYNLLDTRVYNVSTTNDQVEKMNLVTPDRPINDSRYVSFQGVGGTKVLFDYPDLFNVEVFSGSDFHSLKSKQEIKEALTDYLIAKVNTYNSELNKQKSLQSAYYNKYKTEFDMVGKIDSLTNPNRNLQLLPENFLVDSLGEQNLERIVENLYYLNVMWPSKASSNNVLTDLDILKKSYNLSSKVQHIMKTYLSSDSSEDELVNPGYNSNGYEAGYINSDGQDSLEDSGKKLPSLISEIDDGKRKFQQYGSLDDMLNSYSSQKEDSECGVDPDGSVIIWEWPSAISCRLQKTLAKPFQITIDYSCSECDTILGLDGNVYDSSDWTSWLKRAKSSYLDSGEFFRIPYKAYLNSGFSEKQWENYKNNRSAFLPGDKYYNNKQYMSYSDYQKTRYNEIKNNLNFSITPSENILLDYYDDDSDYYLNISSLRDVGQLDISVAGIGNNCIYLDGKNLCESQQDYQLNSDMIVTDELGELNMKIDLKEKQSGVSIFQIKVCDNDSYVCYFKNKVLYITPGKPKSIEIISATDNAIRGGKIPFHVSAYDKYFNPVGKVLENYIVRTDLGRISYNGVSNKQLQFSDFGNAYFIYDSGNLSGSIATFDDIHVNVDSRYTNGGLQYPSSSKRIYLVDGKLTVSSNNSTLSNQDKITYKLPNSFEEIYKIDENKIAQLKKEALIPITLKLQSGNGNPLTSILNIKSKNGFMQPGDVFTKKVNVSSGTGSKLVDKTYFQTRQEYFLTGGNLSFYLHPTFTAGEDVISISIPGMQDFNLKIQVLPGDLNSLDVQLLNRELELGEQTTGKVFLKDIWGNIVTDNFSVITVGAFGGAKINNTDKIQQAAQNGTVEFTVNTIQPGGKSYVYATLEGKQIGQDYFSDYEIVGVKNALWPKEKLNIMYLNLFGNDWGNMWGYFSSNKRIVPYIMNNSEKMLAVTTQLVAPSKLQQSEFVISSNLKVYNSSNKSVKLNLTGGSIYFELGNGYNYNSMINVGKVSEFSINHGYTLPVLINNSIFYFPQPLDSVISSNKFENNAIFVNNKKIIDFANSFIDSSVIVNLTNQTDKGYNKWSINYGGKIVGHLYFNRGDNSLISNFPGNSKISNIYNSQIVFGEGSTNGVKGIGIYTPNSSGKYRNDSSYKSIQDSINPEANIGFRADMQNINNFANGNSVGESTKGFASEFLINFGDPVLTKISENEKVLGTNYDQGIGKLIYSDHDGKILKTVSLDFNGDKNKDLAIGYSDGTIRLLKNYKGTSPYSDLGELMVISDGLKDLFAGDVNGDGYDDLIIKTDENRVRVYINNKGIFDIDGKVVCLDIPGGPNNLSNLSQIYWEDMDKDGKIDIVTNDVSGDIKIFYGGVVGNGYTYLSNDSFSCDANWKTRQNNHVKLVDNYSIKLDSQAHITDESLVHWSGLSSPLPNYGQDGIDTTNPSNIDVTQVGEIVTQGFMESAKYQQLPNSLKPSYENYKGDITYAEIYYLTGTDPVSVYKTFQPVNGDDNLNVGDLVKVQVNIYANRSTSLTYLERLRGPWSISKGDKLIEGFDNMNLPVDTIINPNVSNGFLFMVDNIQVQSGEMISFSYIVVYNGVQSTKIRLENTNNDIFKDIVVSPVDACLKTSWIYESYDKGTNKKGVKDNTIDYKKIGKDLQQLYDEKVEKIQKSSQDYYDSIKGKIDDIDINNNINDLGFDDYGESWEDDSLFSFDASAGGINYSIGAFQGQFQSIQNTIDNGLKGLCKGFKFDDGTCGGIPVPFNMAFLAPGEYNVFGCKLSDDPGTPVFWYPGTMWYTCGDSCSCVAPIPNMKTRLGPPVESAAPSGCKSVPVFTSNIRMYLSPTLTQGLGVAVCYGPYQAGMKGWPNPAGVYMGNCVVAATNFDVFECKEKEGNEENTLDDWQFDIYNIGSCNSEFPDNSRVSPLFYSNDTVGKRGIYIDDSPTIISQLPGIESSFLDMNRINLRPGKKIDLKIESGDVKGIVQCMIRKWVDRQIRYIINNLTNMTIYLYLPDVGQLVDDFSKVDIENLNSIRGNLKDDIDKIGDTWNSVSKEGARLGRSINSDFGNTIKEFTQEYIPSKSALNKVSDTFNNPFRTIQEFFEEVPLIEVETRQIDIQVPFISQENILKQTAYLENRVIKQKQIINDWQDRWKALTGECDTAADPGECKKVANGFLSLNADFEKIIASVEKNIDILQSYKEFPEKLYEWLHVSDRYLSELLCIIDEFLTSIIGWLEENAQRFEKWVDVIILIIGIMETWQILIDFSVDWRSSCSKCRKDEYDYYSCKMSLLCPDLPILPIPPFKLPDIYLDFSHIDLGILLVLPEFVFTPMDIPLIKLPDLPRPPDVGMGVNVILPAIPLLPTLPDLPEIPSFLPTIKLELPYLPPAPKIPELLPEVSGVLKILEFIGYLYCIIKQGIGLVAEWNVKTRIEQLTQRTNRIAPFDFLKLTMVDPPLAGYDIRVDSYIKLKFEFETIYNMAESLANSINEVTNGISSSMYMVQKSINNIDSGIQIPNQEYEINIDLDNGKSDESNSEYNPDNEFDIDNYFDEFFDLESFNMTGTIEYAAAYDKLKKELQYFATNNNSNSSSKANELIDMIDITNKVGPNTQGLSIIHDNLKDLINKERTEIKDLSFEIKDNYEGFLSKLDGKQNNILVSEIDKRTTISTNLFNVNEDIYNKLSKQEHPMKTYFDLNAKVVDRYIAALDNNSNEELNMDKNSYENSKIYLNGLKSKIQSVTPYYDSQNLNNVAALDGSEQGTGVNSVSVDLTQYIKGFYTKTQDGKYRSIIAWEDKGDEIYKNNDYSYEDLNEDGLDDILLWDDSHVYIKFANEKQPEKNVIYGDLFQSDVLDSPTDLKLKTDNLGKITINGQKYKVWDDAYEVSNFKRQGQSYDNITLGWDNNYGNADAYLLKITNRVDNFYDKGVHSSNNNQVDVKYILVTPKNNTYSGYEVFLRDGKRLQTHVGGDMMQVITTDFDDKSIQGLIDSIDRKWLYVKVLNLYKVDLEKRLYIKSPLSNQIVAGRQIWSDADSPTLNVTLIRNSTGKQVSQGYNLNGFVNTNYDIDVNWIDNGKIEYSWVQKGSKILTGTNSGVYKLSNQYFTGLETIQYQFGAIDHAGNKTIQKVNLKIDAPNIQILQVDTQDPLGGKIQAKLSESIDDGTIRFESNRYGYWQGLTGLDLSGNYKQLYQIDKGTNFITGQYYQYSDKIKFDDGLGNEIGSLEVDSGKIQMNEIYSNKYTIKLDFTENVPFVVIRDNEKSLFKLHIGSQKLLGINITNGAYESVDNIQIDGQFKGGNCIKKPLYSNECMMYISTQGQIYVPNIYKTDFKGTYNYNSVMNSAEYKIFDDQGNSLFDIYFQPAPFR